MDLSRVLEYTGEVGLGGGGIMYESISSGVISWAGAGGATATVARKVSRSSVRKSADVAIESWSSSPQ